MNKIVTGTTCGDNETIILILEYSTRIDTSKIYQIPDGRCVSFSSTGETTTSQINSYITYGAYDNCDECYKPLSANTESYACVICCPCESGSTVNQQSLPHPIYSNGQNKGVEQLNAVTIGGNGLNA